MPTPLLKYQPLSQNHRVVGFEVAGDEQARIYNTKSIISGFSRRIQKKFFPRSTIKPILWGKLAPLPI
jgi:hypothetical protein